MILHALMSADTSFGPIDDEMIQMHALDIRVNQIQRLGSCAEIPKEGKTVQGMKLDEPTLYGSNGSEYWHLFPGVYSFDAIQGVEMAKGEAGWLVPRSSLTRNGVDVRSALYDAGYVGGVNGIIIVHNPYGIKIEKGARIAQFIVIKAETYKLYEGQYQGGKK